MALDPVPFQKNPIGSPVRERWSTSGNAGPLGSLLHASPSLAARFRAVIDFPGFTPAQLTAIFASLAEEAGLTLAPSAQAQAARVLAREEGHRGSGNARLAVRLLNIATARQGLRVAGAPAAARDPAALRTLTEADIPGQLHSDWGPAEEEAWPGQYLLSGRGTVTAGPGGTAGLSSRAARPGGSPGATGSR